MDRSHLTAKSSRSLSKRCTENMQDISLATQEEIVSGQTETQHNHVMDDGNVESIFDYQEGMSTTYTGMMEEILSSQEERRLHDQLNDSNVSFTDLPLGATHSQEAQNILLQQGTRNAEPFGYNMTNLEQLQQEHNNLHEEETRCGESSEFLMADLEHLTEKENAIVPNTYIVDQSVNSELNNESNSRECMSIRETEQLSDSVWELDMFTNLQLQQENHETKIAAPDFNANNGSAVQSNVGKASSEAGEQNECENEQITEEDVESFLQKEEIAASEGNNAAIDSKYTPVIGQEFKTKDDATHFFCIYAMIAGFKCGHKYMTEMQKALIRTLNSNNIKIRQMIAILSYLRGNVTVNLYDKKAVSNFRTKINREVSRTDLMQALDFLRKKKSEDPTFFYRFDLDESKKIRNVFWSDGSSMRYYLEYGDL
ncbi:hypothetical protein ACP4OV_004460 [Aristida adscensionis]